MNFCRDFWSGSSRTSLCGRMTSPASLCKARIPPGTGGVGQSSANPTMRGALGGPRGWGLRPAAGESSCVSGTGTELPTWVRPFQTRRARGMLRVRWPWYEACGRDRAGCCSPGVVPGPGACGAAPHPAPGSAPPVPAQRDPGVVLRPPGPDAGPQLGHELR